MALVLAEPTACLERGQPMVLVSKPVGSKQLPPARGSQPGDFTPQGTFDNGDIFGCHKLSGACRWHLMNLRMLLKRPTMHWTALR